MVALTLPHTMKIRLSFEHGAIIDGLPGWRELFALPVPERMQVPVRPRRAGRDSTQGRSRRRPGIIGALARWENLVIDETFAPAERRATKAVRWATWPRTTGKEPFDALLDIVIADELRTGLRPPIAESEADWELRAKVWQDPRTVVGGSDAGAHLDMMCGAIYSTSMLGDGVRRPGTCCRGRRRCAS